MAANRLREAREYVGFRPIEVATLLSIPVHTLEAIEEGHLEIPDNWLATLSRLYRRPVAWLKGEPAPPVPIPADLRDLMEPLSDHDRAEVVRFVKWLQHGKEAGDD